MYEEIVQAFLFRNFVQANGACIQAFLIKNTSLHRGKRLGKWELIMCKRRKKKKNKIIVDFLGQERNDVTGSAVLIKYPKGNDK